MVETREREGGGGEEENIDEIILLNTYKYKIYVNYRASTLPGYAK